jgi:hypothetical protein
MITDAKYEARTSTNFSSFRAVRMLVNLMARVAREMTVPRKPVVNTAMFMVDLSGIRSIYIFNDSSSGKSMYRNCGNTYITMLTTEIKNRKRVMIWSISLNM